MELKYLEENGGRMWLADAKRRLRKETGFGRLKCHRLLKGVVEENEEFSFEGRPNKKLVVHVEKT